MGRAFGSRGRGLPTKVLKGGDSGGMPAVGNRFDPGEGWEQFILTNTGSGNLASSETSYPEGFDGKVRPADATDDSGNGARADGRRGLKLSQTSDDLNAGSPGGCGSRRGRNGPPTPRGLGARSNTRLR